MGLLSRIRICIVDDNRDNADSLAMVLEAAVFEVHCAYDGPKGLALIRQIKPHVAILDIGMPGMTGYDVAKAVRSEFGELVGLIAITGWGQKHDVNAALSAGFHHHFTKPADASQVLAKIYELAKRLDPGKIG
jgi:DNA-binding response OmpR family regulator